MLISHKVQGSPRGVEIASGTVWDPHGERLHLPGAHHAHVRGLPGLPANRKASLGGLAALGSRDPPPRKVLAAPLGNHKVVGPGSSGPSTDLLEDLGAEPRQNLDTVLGEIVDHSLPLPMADHAEVAA